MDMITRIFPGEYKSLSKIGNFVEKQAVRAKFNPKDVYSILTAVDEACSNVIDHAYGGENLGLIEISIEFDDTEFIVSILDDGLPFEPSEVPYPDITSPLDSRKERGLGVFIMRRLMDEVNFDFSTTSKNKLVMKKFRVKNEPINNGK